MQNAHWGFLGGSAVINPSGQYVASPLMEGEETVHTEIDLKDIVKRKGYIDPVGKDSRWDAIRLDTGGGHYSPYATGFPSVKKEAEPVDRSSEMESVSELKAQIEKLTKEVTRLKSKE